VLIIVQNLPVPFDRRVWLECQALVEAGHEVSVVCPRGPGEPRHDVVAGVHLFKYWPYPSSSSSGKAGYLAEYLYSFTMTAWLTARVWRRRRVDAIQTCNPPDIFWPLLLALRGLGGARCVFDQHDLCPELYRSRYPTGGAGPYRLLRLLERATYASAHHVIATNESYRATAIARGAKRPDEVTVVRTGPDPDWLRRQAPDPALRRGRRFMACYIGVMGPQDGVDVILRAAAILVHEMGRHDIGFILMGKGDCFDDLLALRAELDLDDVVEFTGRAPDELVFRVMSTADLGLSPDPKNPLNDVSTMNKTMEYMAFELPVVAFDLRETRVSAGDAAIYAEPNDIGLYAKAIAELLDNEEQRKAMGALARARVEDELAWQHQRGAYVGVYADLLRRPSPAATASTATGSPLSGPG